MSSIDTIAPVKRSVSITGKIGIPRTFPREEIQRVLQSELLDYVRGIALVKSMELEDSDSAIMSQAIEIDSLTVVSIICEFEHLVGFEIRSVVVKAGGYNSIKEAVKEVMPKVEKLWEKKLGETRGQSI